MNIRAARLNIEVKIIEAERMKPRYESN